MSKSEEETLSLVFTSTNVASRSTKPKTVDLVDSCANRFLSKLEADFTTITHRKCRINGTAGSIPGYIGFLKPNVLNLQCGVYFPDLPDGISRILPWLGPCNLCETGWNMHFEPQGGHLVNRRNGTQVPIYNHPELSLPVLGVELFKLDSIEDDELYACKTVEDYTASAYLTDLQLHRRLSHWHVDGLKVTCPDCDRSKGQSKPHAKVRPVQIDPGPLKTIAIDFATGIKPVSIRGARCCLVVICDSIKKVFIRPLGVKSDVVEEIEKVIKGIRQDYSVSMDEKVVHFLRRDNEPVLNSKHMANMLQLLRVCDAPGVPHNPEHNGTCERYMRSLFGAVRANLIGVDRRLWCYCAQYAADVWNRIPHKYSKMPQYNGMSPEEILNQKTGRNSRKTGLDLLRTFGCLVYFREQIQHKVAGKLEPLWRRGVFLGLCPISSGWLIGTYTDSSKTLTGMQWSEYSTQDVKFREDILIKNIDDLKPNSRGIYIPVDYLSDLASGTSWQIPASPALEQAVQPGSSPGVVGTEYAPRHSEDARSDLFVENLEAPCDGTSDGAQPDVEGKEQERNRSPRPPGSKGSSVTSPSGDTPKRRGRPKGAKDKSVRVRRSKAELEKLRKDANAFVSVIGGVENLLDEDFVEAHVLLSVASALKSPDADKWQKVIDKEEARLLIKQTWEAATDEQLATAKQVLPIAIILTVKRDGTLKARAVVLGNLDRSGAVDTFAPVVSQAANRLLLVEAASSGDHVLPYDIDSAFLNAELDRDVLVRLPPIWAKKHSVEVVKLKKALYGLKDAPRAWFKEYTKILKELGWTPCESAPGLWRKPSSVVARKFLKKSVYVDDNLTAGPDPDELMAELNKIFTHVPGRLIEFQTITDEKGISWTKVDFLGATVYYSRESRSFRLTMEDYIDKIQKKFSIVVGKSVFSPNFDETAFLREGAKKVEGYNLREIVGALQWVATVARPDIIVPVATLARYVNHPVTQPMVNAGKKILKYLITTRTTGLGYSPAQEKEFEAIYSQLLPEGRDMPRVNLFSDAGFANCLQTMRSTSGSIMYYRSCPIIWRSNRQTVRAYSTAESEYIAASDTIVLSETHNFTDFFRPLPSQMVEAHSGISPSLEDAILWLDNQSAIVTAKSEDTKPKSRHYALRYLRVRDAASKIVFCPTNLMKADGLTKLECSVSQRRLLLHNVTNPVDYVEDYGSDSSDCDEQKEDDVAHYSVVYSAYFGF